MKSLFFSTQVEALRRKIDNFNAANMYVQNIICDYCKGKHAYSDCPVDNWCYPSFEQINFVGDFYKPHVDAPFCSGYFYFLGLRPICVEAQIWASDLFLWFVESLIPFN